MMSMFPLSISSKNRRTRALFCCGFILESMRCARWTVNLSRVGRASRTRKATTERTELTEPMYFRAFCGQRMCFLEVTLIVLFPVFLLRDDGVFAFRDLRLSGLQRVRGAAPVRADRDNGQLLFQLVALTSGAAGHVAGPHQRLELVSARFAPKIEQWHDPSR